MRILILNLIVAALALSGATSASAVAINMSLRSSSGDINALEVSDTVIVDVFADLDLTNITLFSTSVMNTNAAAISYDPVASAALPVIYPAPVPAYGTQGDQPGYLLYAPSPVGMPGYPPTFLEPHQTPWQIWVAPPPGFEQVNINYAETSLDGTTNPGALNIWIASLVFHVDQDFDNAELFPTMDSSNLFPTPTEGTQILFLGDLTEIEITDVNGVVALQGVLVPEPTTAALIGISLLGMAIWGRRG